MKAKIDLFDIKIDPISRQEAVDAIYGFFKDGGHGARIVVTPNLDHLVQLNSNENFRAAYGSAALVLADGNPVVWASRLLGKPIPETVPGSDLSMMLLEQSNTIQGFSIFLLGAAPGVADRASMIIAENYPNVAVVGSYSPPMGFEKDSEELGRILHMVNEVAPDLLLVGLGAPKQELWAYSAMNALRAKVVLCAGATIDFIAGEKKRAPVWVRKMALEWLYRMVLEPRRLVARYFCDAVVFPYLVVREMIGNRER